jgi:thymidylate synthase (FAD)
MEVKLISSTPNPEYVVTFAAKTCYSTLTSHNLDVESMKTDTQKAMIKKILKSNHLSPLEHVSFTFSIEGLSRAALAQLTRHRIASYSVRSQRYVSEENFDYIIPNELLADKKITNNNDLLNKYLKFMDDTKSLYKDMLSQGIKKEDARYILPNCTLTNLIMTMNARELLHFFSLRCCNRAQAEIRTLANNMLAIVKELAPNIFAKAGPNCVKGYCTEEKSCGKLWKKINKGV